MMDVARSLLLLAVAATATALLREARPLRQILALNLLGVELSLLFLAFQAPDVALAEITVGAAAQPLVFLAILARLHAGGKHDGDGEKA